MPKSDALVTVVIPAYNAASTIEETLASVSVQTYDEIEIVVVDDGSSDKTFELAQHYARKHERMRVVSQTNAGVAAARNLGTEVANGSLIAFLDADDLWRPTKIARQVRMMQARGASTGLVYTWNAIIDDHNRVIAFADRPDHEGDVLAQLCCGNFVGNGSAALIRREFILAAGGFDPSLRGRAAQGCEDWKLYLHLAEVCDFAVIRDFLTGYRQMQNTMSADVHQIMRSDQVVREEFLARHPEYEQALSEGRVEYLGWLLRRELAASRWRNCQTILGQLNKERKRHPWRAIRTLKTAAAGHARSRIWPADSSKKPAYLQAPQ